MRRRTVTPTSPARRSLRRLPVLLAAVLLPVWPVTSSLAADQGTLRADGAVTRGDFLDVYATSGTDRLEVSGAGLATTAMVHDKDSDRHYARLALSGAPPASVQVSDGSKDPAGTVTVEVSDVSVTTATYDGGRLTVLASGAGDLTATGLGKVRSGVPTSFPVTAPPRTITVTSAAGATETAPVGVTGGAATPPEAPPPASGAPTAAVAVTSAAVVPGGSVVLDGSNSVGVGLRYSWALTSGGAVTLTDAASARATVTVPPAVSKDGPTGAPTADTQAVPSVVTLTVSDSQGRKATERVTVTPVEDVLTPTALRHDVGKELRVAGTTAVAGPAPLADGTRVYVWDVTPGRAPRLLGSPAVADDGAWELQLHSGGFVTGPQITAVSVQSTAGGVLVNQPMVTG
jgi:hypothetical protein